MNDEYQQFGYKRGGHLGEDIAFRKLTAFAYKVAGELAAAGVPHDTYVDQKQHQVSTAERSGFFGMSTKKVILTVPDRHVEMAGWRVFSEVMEEKYRADISGTIRSSHYHELIFEVWLAHNGGLTAVSLRQESVSNNMPGSVANVVPTKLTSTPFELPHALRLDGSSVWRTRNYRENGMQIIDEWREYRPRNRQGPACLKMSNSLASLRKRAL